MLHILDPCRVCNTISAVVLSLLGLTLGGYIGKLYHLQGYEVLKPDQLNWTQILMSDTFWTPDLIFWTYGILTVILIYSLVATINLILEMFGLAVSKTLCCIWRTTITCITRALRSICGCRRTCCRCTTKGVSDGDDDDDNESDEDDKNDVIINIVESNVRGSSALNA